MADLGCIRQTRLTCWIRVPNWRQRVEDQFLPALKREINRRGLAGCPSAFVSSWRATSAEQIVRRLIEEEAGAFEEAEKTFRLIERECPAPLTPFTRTERQQRRQSRARHSRSLRGRASKARRQWSASSARRRRSDEIRHRPDARRDGNLDQQFNYRCPRRLRPHRRPEPVRERRIHDEDARIRGEHHADRATAISNQQAIANNAAARINLGGALKATEINRSSGMKAVRLDQMSQIISALSRDLARQTEMAMTLRY